MSAATAPVIELIDVWKIYGAGATAVHALAQINLTIEAGEYCAVMGPSGSGKSTLMNIVGCLDRPTHGHYLLEGTDVADQDDEELAHIRNRRVGFIFQQFLLLPQLTALENVMLPMVYARVPQEERRERAIAALVRVGLEERLHNLPSQLSGGQQQRVAIARAIVNRPILLLADEPTGALDTATAREVMRIFGELNASGITVLVVTHAPEVARLTRRILWFRDGRLLHAHLRPEELGQLVAAQAQ